MNKIDEFQTKKYSSQSQQFVNIFNIPDERPSLQHAYQILTKFSVFPYENLSKIIKLNRTFDTPERRYPGDIIEDFNRYKLGGTCFSLTYFLKSIFSYFGYDTYIIMADMAAGKNTHCALGLNFQGNQYLLDPGYLIHKPLAIVKDSEKIHDAYGSAILTYKIGTDQFSLSTVKKENISWRYSFYNVSTNFDDFIGYWDKSFHWMTMHGICLSKRDLNGFLYLHNNYLKKEGGKENFKGNFKEDMAEVIEKYFHIPGDVVRKANEALQDNLHYDKELGYIVPRWVK